jgi:hypothetical protein
MNNYDDLVDHKVIAEAKAWADELKIYDVEIAEGATAVISRLILATEAGYDGIRFRSLIDMTDPNHHRLHDIYTNFKPYVVDEKKVERFEFEARLFHPEMCDFTSFVAPLTAETWIPFAAMPYTKFLLHVDYDDRFKVGSLGESTDYTVPHRVLVDCTVLGTDKRNELISQFKIYNSVPGNCS